MVCQYMPVFSVNEIWHLVEAAWAAVPVIQSLYDSTHRCITAVITTENGFSRYLLQRIYASKLLDNLNNCYICLINIALLVFLPCILALLMASSIVHIKQITFINYYSQTSTGL